MSQVYSFRLSDDNPREAQARGVIKTRVNEGYSLRQIIVESLLICYDKQNGNDEVYTLLERIKEMISELENTASLGNNDEDEKSGLSSSFKVAVRKSAKYGIRSE